MLPDEAANGANPPRPVGGSFFLSIFFWENEGLFFILTVKKLSIYFRNNQ